MASIENYWASISNEKPFVAPSDFKFISKFNSLDILEQFKLRLDVVPEPYIGDPRAPVYLLNLNPGFNEADVEWHGKSEISRILKNNLLHSNIEYPFYPLNPKLGNAPVSGWWLQKLKRLIVSTSQEKVSRGVFCVEYHGYHSQKYKAIPKRILEGHLPTQQYAAYIVRKAIEEDKYIVLMRSRKEWYSLVPELESYNNFYKIKNPQNPQISVNNLEKYEHIVKAIEMN